jgi:IclR family acetate operon transcriptional repressor
MARPDSAPDSPRQRGRPRGWDDKSEQNTIKSLDRAMEVLERLSELPGVTLSALADDLSQSPATIYRVLVTLEARGMVEHDPVTQNWHIGARAFLIGARFLRRTSLVERARPILRGLMEATGETANLGIPREASILFVAQVETHASIRAFFPPGTSSPMHASGIGKAILAHIDADRRDRLIAASGLERFTAHTLCETGPLIGDLDQARARGYAIDGEEKTLGMRCIAAPVFDHLGEAVAGISVSGPAARVSVDDQPRIGAAVRNAARALTQAIAGQVE